MDSGLATRLCRDVRQNRRGRLVVDVADLIKDIAIMPEAFLAAMRGDSEQEFRNACRAQLTESLDFMLETLKKAAVIGSKRA